MAIGVGSNVLRVSAAFFAACPSGCVVGVGTGGAGSWEVAYADGSHDTNASTAGLLELTTAVAIGADPTAGQTLATKTDVNSLYLFQSIGLACTNGVNRFWYCVPVGVVPPNYRGLAYVLSSAHAVISGVLPQ